MKQQARANHYVPQWYQKRFLTSGSTHFFYLDLKPETLVCDGVSHQRDAMLRWGPRKCFYRDDLYTVKLGSWTTDQIERRFFGIVDSRGREAVAHFPNSRRFKSPRGAQAKT